MTYPALVERFGTRSQHLSIADLEEGTDYDYTPGGVTTMVLPALKQMLEMEMIDQHPFWISLGPGAPSEIVLEHGIKLLNISMDHHELANYAKFKEGIWNEIHGLGPLSFTHEEYEAYVTYNWTCAKIMLQMLKDIDVFWIHDFQQLHVGNIIGPSAPTVLRWHIPFRMENISQRLRTLVLKSIEGFDAIIVSTRKDLQGLIRAGYRGRAYSIYPYHEPTEWNRNINSSNLDLVRSKFNLREHDRIILTVARMDPVKNQNIVIKALSKLKQNTSPNQKLVLAGNGSFTGSAKGGLGHPKALLWKSYLEELVRELKLEESVIFTGHVTHEELDALYSISEMVVVPSAIEGFNLTAVEGWLHSKPCVVSSGAGVSELVHNDVNGYVFASSNYDDLAHKLEALAKSPEFAIKLGENGSMMARQCDVRNASSELYEIFSETSKMYSSKDKV